ncbi:NADPH-dependent FMN reductase [Micromonospora chersina]|uniref:NADPH-dependent FMN reductase n=1 Tax=Micromonospora chersina TaxID=47854 RepID=UPI0037124060
MTRIGIIIGSTRPGRNGETVARWVHEIASQRDDAQYELVDTYDGYVFVTPEYNHSTSGALKNAIDFLYAEWNNKAAGFVSYGSVGGTRAVEHLRLVVAELQMADVRAQVALSLFTDFENFSVFKPGDHQVGAVNTMLDQLAAWSGALAHLRAGTTMATPQSGA